MRRIESEAFLVEGADRTWSAITSQSLYVSFKIEKGPLVHYRFGDARNLFLPTDLVAKYAWSVGMGWQFSKANLSGLKIKADGTPGRSVRMNEDYSLRSIDASPQEWPTGAALAIRACKPSDNRPIDIVAAEQVA